MGELVRPLDTARHRAGQLTIADAHAELVAQVGEGVTPADHRWAHVYAGRILRADDRAGREQGRITRGDEVRWADVIALRVVAAGRAALVVAHGVLPSRATSRAPYASRAARIAPNTVGSVRPVL